MYKVHKIEIDGFWQKHTATATFSDDVNIVIGRNGSGKTTFIDILESVLSVDMTGLAQNDFAEVTISLVKGGSRRTVVAKKVEQSTNPFPVIQYQIWKKKFNVRVIGGDELRYSPTIRRRIDLEANEVREQLSALVSMASLSVYRIRLDMELEYAERPNRRLIAPVDIRLLTLMKNLTRYHLELSQKARAISADLQKSVLLSLLYEESEAARPAYITEFDKDTEEKNLLSAYEQLGLANHRGLKKRINEHVEAIEKAASNLRLYLDGDKERPIDWGPLDAHRLTGSVVERSLQAKRATSEIFAQSDLFLKNVESFIVDKKFYFKEGDLIIEKNGFIPFARLSSGEKQLLILLIEALLQREQPYVFIADEPELSLHVAWQRKILPAIREINPNAQIIVATHSPEVAGRYPEAMIDMEEILDAKT